MLSRATGLLLFALLLAFLRWLRYPDGMDGHHHNSLIMAIPWSVRRRYGLSVLLVAMTAYSALLGFMVALNVPAIIILDALVFVTAIALAQALVYRGRKPRFVSTVTGAIVAGLLSGGQVYWGMNDPKYPEGVAWAPYAAFAIALSAATFGAIVGYVVGALIGLLSVSVELLHRALIPDFRPSERALKEVERRSAEFDAGRMEAVPWKDVEASIADLLSKRN